jgi:hypothetical protein
LIWNSELGQSIRDAFPEIDITAGLAKQQTGLSPEDLERVSLFVPNSFNLAPRTFPALILISTKSPVDTEKFAKNMGFTIPHKVGKTEIFSGFQPPFGEAALCFLSDKLIVAGEGNELLQFLQNPPRPQQDGSLKEAIKLAEKEQVVLFVQNGHG